MPLDVWFPLAIHYADDAVDTHSLAIAVDAVLGRAPDRLGQSAAWTGDIHGDDQLHLDPQFETVTSAVARAAADYLVALGYQLDEMEMYAQRSWAVVSQPGQHVSPHCHANAHLSAVVYLQAPAGSGALRFSNTAQPNALSAGAGSAGSLRTLNALNYASSLYEPVDGRVVVFPAHQRHEVMVNESDADRLSLSYDLW